MRLVYRKNSKFAMSARIPLMQVFKGRYAMMYALRCPIRVMGIFRYK